MALNFSIGLPSGYWVIGQNVQNIVLIALV